MMNLIYSKKKFVFLIILISCQSDLALSQLQKWCFQEDPNAVITPIGPRWMHVDRQHEKIEISTMLIDADKEDGPGHLFASQYSASVTGVVKGILASIGTILQSPLWLFDHGAAQPDYDYDLVLALPSQASHVVFELKHNETNNKSIERNEAEKIEKDSKIKFPPPFETSKNDFYRLILGEICADKKLHEEKGSWVPPPGKLVDVYGDWVIDIMHDRNIEIHPIQWLRWEMDRAPGATFQKVRFRISVFIDASGRFSPRPVDVKFDFNAFDILGFEAFGFQGMQNMPKNVDFHFDINRDFNSMSYDTTSLHPERPIYWRNHTKPEPFKLEQIVPGEPGTYRLTGTVDDGNVHECGSCASTNYATNDAGYWDGFVCFWVTPKEKSHSMTAPVDSTHMMQGDSTRVVIPEQPIRPQETPLSPPPLEPYKGSTQEKEEGVNKPKPIVPGDSIKLELPGKPILKDTTPKVPKDSTIKKDKIIH